MFGHNINNSKKRVLENSTSSSGDTSTELSEIAYWPDDEMIFPSQSIPVAVRRYKKKLPVKIVDPEKTRHFDPDVPYVTSNRIKNKGPFLIRVESFLPQTCGEFSTICQRLLWDEIKKYHIELPVPPEVLAFRKEYNLSLTPCWVIDPNHKYALTIRNDKGYMMAFQACRTGNGARPTIHLGVHALALSDGGRKPYKYHAAHLCGRRVCCQREHMSDQPISCNVDAINCKVGYKITLPAEKGRDPVVITKLTCKHGCIPVYMDDYGRFCVANQQWLRECESITKEHEENEIHH